MRAAIVFAAGLAMAGCVAQDGWQYRYGPNHRMPAGQVAEIVRNQAEVMSLLRAQANSNDWYEVTLAGFNFVDEQCDAYLHELFVLDRTRNRLRSAITGTGTITQAILGVTPASKASIAIVAQAFGLASQLTDEFTNSYLFQSQSSNVVNIVGELQRQYRDQAGRDHAAIRPSMSAAYARIRGYLRLCLPPTIEAEVTKLLARATARPGAPSPESRGSGSSMSVTLEAVPRE